MESLQYSSKRKKNNKKNKDKENQNSESYAHYSKNQESSNTKKESLLVKKQTTYNSLSIYMLASIFEFFDNQNMFQIIKLNRKSRNLIFNNLLFKKFIQLRKYLQTIKLTFHDDMVNFCTQNLLNKLKPGLSKNQFDLISNDLLHLCIQTDRINFDSLAHPVVQANRNLLVNYLAYFPKCKFIHLKVILRESHPNADLLKNVGLIIKNNKTIKSLELSVDLNMNISNIFVTILNNTSIETLNIAANIGYSITPLVSSNLEELCNFLSTTTTVRKLRFNISPNISKHTNLTNFVDDFIGRTKIKDLEFFNIEQNHRNYYLFNSINKNTHTNVLTLDTLQINSTAFKELSFNFRNLHIHQNIRMNTSIHTLVLKGIKFKDRSNLTHISNLLQNCNTITTLSLQDTNLGNGHGGGILQFFNNINTYRSLENLIMRSTQLNNSLFNQLVDNLLHNDTIVNWDVSNNRLYGDAIYDKIRELLNLNPIININFFSSIHSQDEERIKELFMERDFKLQKVNFD